MKAEEGIGELGRWENGALGYNQCSNAPMLHCSILHPFSPCLRVLYSFMKPVYGVTTNLALPGSLWGRQQSAIELSLITRPIPNLVLYFLLSYQRV